MLKAALHCRAAFFMDREVLWINYKSVEKHLKNYWRYSIGLLLAEREKP
jgi:hypothetical protein